MLINDQHKPMLLIIIAGAVLIALVLVVWIVNG